MNRTLGIAAVAAVALACQKPPSASADDCRKACSHVADIKVAPLKAKSAGVVHEFDEEVDRQEDSSAKNIAQIKADMAGKPVEWRPAGFDRLPAKVQQQIRERHEAEVAQLRYDREHAIQHAQESLAKARKAYEDAKAKAEADGKKATEEAFNACNPSCLQRPAKYAACLQRVQAVEDVDVCDHS